MAEGDDGGAGPPTAPTGAGPEPPPPTSGPPIVLSQSAVPRSGLGFATSEALARMGAPDPPSRYEVGGLLGRGGMGEVHVARDPRLGRDVALKTARPEDPHGAERLAREATTTARLEHPNIVPVYAAGRGPDGAPYYTMRVLHGRTLARAITEAPDLAARLRLVRHVLLAAEAIAYAHGRGILHRDVKPPNILVGAFGETVITDWGLACATDAQDAERGGGTPGFGSPEQLRGDRVDGRTDVYGLGATLAMILTGVTPPLTVPPLRALAPDAPADLAAIADRALAPRPEDRYPSARAMADDLSAWFEGRRVGAHVYSTRELWQRLWARWRWPILGGATATLAIAVAVGVGWWRTEQARARAEASEASAVRAQEAEASALASALLAQSLTATREGRPMDAEILAVHALLRRELPTARGVLATFGGRPRMSLLHGAPLPPCVTRATSLDGSRFLCVNPDGISVVSVADPTGTLAHVRGDWVTGFFAGANDRALLQDQQGQLYTWGWPEAPRAVGVKSGAMMIGRSDAPGTASLVSNSSSIAVTFDPPRWFQWRACGSDVADEANAVAADGSIYTTCADRRVVHGAPGEPGAEVARLAERDALGRIFLGPDGVLALSTAHGALVILDRDGVERERYEGGGDGVRSVSIRPDRIAAAFRDETVRVWARATGVTLGTLRVPGASVTFLDDAGTELRLVSDVAEDRLVALPRYPPRIPLTAGVGGLSLSPDGERVAVALGDGSTEEYDLRDGRRTGRWRWQSGVNKDVAYSLDGRWLAPALTAAVEQRLLPRPDGPAWTTVLPAIGLRRVTWLAGGWLLAPSYVPAVWGWREGMPTAERVLETPMRELERSADGQTAASLDGEGWLWRWTAGDPPQARRIAPFEAAVACAPLGADTLLLQDTYVMRVDDTGTVRWRASTGSKGHDIAVAPDGLHVATTLVDGDVLVWRVDAEQPVARLVGHTSRVGEAAWSPDGQWLVTGGWDDSIRLWWMGTLETPAEVLRDEIERAWGRGLPAVLDDPLDAPARPPQPVGR